MKHGFYFISTFLSLLILFAAVPPSSNAEETAVTLRVGIFPFEPINFGDETGEAQGLYPDLLREIANKEHWQLEFVPGSWGEGLDRLQSGDIDLMESVAYSEKRAEIMDFTHESVMELWGQVFIRPEGGVHNVSDLTGRRVAIMHDDISGANFLTTARKFNVHCEILEFPTHGDVFTAVKEGAVDAGVAPQHFGLRHAKAYDLVPSTIQFSPFSIYFATKKGMHFDILTKIDRQLILWKQDKESFYYQRLNHWLGTQSLSSSVIPLWMLWSLAAIAVSVIVLLIMSMVLKSQVKKRTSELQASEEYNRMLFDQSPIGLAVARMDGTLVDVNSAYAHIIGKTIDDTLNLTYWDITPDKYALQEQQQLASLTSTGSYGPYEKEYIHTDGHLVSVQQNGLLIELKGEKHIWSSVEDITERKRAEREQSLMHDRFVSIMNSLDALVYVADMESYELLFINEYGRKLFGNTEGKICWQVLQSNQSEPCSFCTNRRLVENEEPTGVYVWEFQNTVTGDWFQCRDKAIRWQDNRLVRMEIATDITEHKLAAKELEKQKTTFESLFESIPDAILLTNMERRIVAINQGFTNIFGHTLDEVVGKPTSVIYASEEESLRQGRLRYNITAEEAAKPYIVNYRRKDGTSLPGETIGTKVLAPDGEPLGFFGLIRDISERIKTDQERIDLENQLHQAQKIESIGQLAGGVAHDFNNMLGVILGHAELAMIKAETSSPLLSAVEAISAAAKRSADLTRQLLTFARKQTISPKVINLNEEITGILNMLQRLIGENINLSWNPTSNLWSVKVDTSQIDQILANLCVNARDAIAGNGKISIKTENHTLDEGATNALPYDVVPGDYVLLSVSDNGCGMDKQVQAHIFEPFYTTKEVGSGTGLGLATVYGAVKQNHGFITVYSEVGLGTIFNIYLPRTSKAVEAKQKTAEKPLLRGTETILLVEDDEMLLHLVTTMLEESGYTVLSAATTELAQTLAREHSGQIELLISDMIMPAMNGRELSAKLQTLRPKMKVLFLSGYPADIISNHGVIKDEIHFLQKPFSLEVLTSKVREVLDEYRT